MPKLAKNEKQSENFIVYLIVFDCTMLIDYENQM